MSALTRMANNDHKKVEILPGDTVIISATPIPGNEKLVSRTIDNLYNSAPTLFTKKATDVHVSGHVPARKKLKLMTQSGAPEIFYCRCTANTAIWLNMHCLPSHWGCRAKISLSAKTAL